MPISNMIFNYTVIQEFTLLINPYVKLYCISETLSFTKKLGFLIRSLPIIIFPFRMPCTILAEMLEL
jgi:hypothetical protein